MPGSVIDGQSGGSEHKFIIFVAQVCNEFRWCRLLHVLQSDLDEVVLVSEKLKVLLTVGFFFGDVLVCPVVLDCQCARVCE